jgi:hypothetical protein
MSTTISDFNNIIKDHNLKDLVSLIRKVYRDWLDAVNSVIIDQKNILDGKSLYMAVDFKHIYEYIFPNEILQKIDNVSDGGNISIKEIIWHKYAGLTFLFNNIEEIKEPVLFAPHVLELLDTIKKHQSYQIYSIEYELKYRLNEDELQLVKNAAIILKDTSEKYHEDRIKLENLIITKFHNLFLLFTGFSLQGIERLKDLISNKKIIIEDDIVSDYSDIIQNCIENPVANYLDIFNYLRKNRSLQNYRDAKLLEIVINLNKHFIENNINKKVYILSDTQTFSVILHPADYITKLQNELKDYELLIKEELDYNKKEKEAYVKRELEHKIDNIISLFKKHSTDLSIFGSEDTLFRSPEIFVAYMIDSHSHLSKNNPDFKKTRVETINHLEKRKARLLQFNFFDSAFDELVKECTNNCHTCSNINKCNSFKSDIEQWWQIYNEKITLDLLDSFKEFQGGFIQNIEKNIEKGIKEIIEYLSDPSNSFLKSVFDKKEEIDKSYIETANHLKLNLQKTGFNLHEELIFQLKPLRRIPFPLSFESNVVKDVLTEAQSFIKNYELMKEKDKECDETISEIKTISNKIIDISFDKTCGPDADLLFAILNFNFNKFQNANNILIDSLQNPFIKNISEYQLVRILTLTQYACNIRDEVVYNEAKVLCEKTLKKHLLDSRVYYLYGVTIGRGIQTGLEKECSIDVSINYFEQALKHLQDENRKPLYEANIWNSIAFSICLIEDELTAEHIEYALSALNMMSNLIPEQEWDANFVDTKGLVFYRKAQYSELESNIIELLNESIVYFKKALEIGLKNKYLYYERREIERHLKMANELLLSYTYNDDNGQTKN